MTASEIPQRGLDQNSSFKWMSCISMMDVPSQQWMFQLSMMNIPSIYDGCSISL